MTFERVWVFHVQSLKILGANFCTDKSGDLFVCREIYNVSYVYLDMCILFSKALLSVELSLHFESTALIHLKSQIMSYDWPFNLVD